VDLKTQGVGSPISSSMKKVGFSFQKRGGKGKGKTFQERKKSTMHPLPNESRPLLTGKRRKGGQEGRGKKRGSSSPLGKHTPSLKERDKTKKQRNGGGEKGRDGGLPVSQLKEKKPALLSHEKKGTQKKKKRDKMFWGHRGRRGEIGRH